MAEAWKEMINQQLAVDRQRHANNPGVQNISTLLSHVMQTGMQDKANAKQDVRDTKKMAMQATFNRYPQVAAQEAGIDVPQTGLGTGAGGMPDGMSLKQIQVDENGNPSYQYGEDLSESALAKMYTDYVTEVRKSNQQVTNTSQLLGQEPQLVDVPTFEDFKAELFGIDKQVVSQGLQNMDDETLLQQFGYTEDDVQNTMKEEGMQREQVMAFLRSQVGG